MTDNDLWGIETITLTAGQRAIAERGHEGQIFLEGPFGGGKTTTAAARIHWLLEQGVPGETIILWLPHRPLIAPYQQRVWRSEPEAPITILTLGSLAQQIIRDHWSEIAPLAGFALTSAPPVFLNHETAQFLLTRRIDPLIRAGAFQSVRMDRARIVVQILEAMNRAAGAGFGIEEIEPRLRTAWVNDPARRQFFADAQAAALEFQGLCLAEHWLDFSLQVQVLTQVAWKLPAVRSYLKERYRYLVADNIEEDPAAAHDLLLSWLTDFESALILFDLDAGYRTRMGADPVSAERFRERCDEEIRFKRSYFLPSGLAAWGIKLLEHLDPAWPIPSDLDIAARKAEREALAVQVEAHHYFPEMLEAVVQSVADMIHAEGIVPGEIALLLPTISDAVGLSLTERLGERGIQTRLLRPSQALRDEPALSAFQTLYELAHPRKGRRLHPHDFVQALRQFVPGIDPIRSQLILDHWGQPEAARLSGLPALKEEFEERLSPEVVAGYERLRSWLAPSLPSLLSEFLAAFLDNVSLTADLPLAILQSGKVLMEAAHNFEETLGGSVFVEEDSAYAFWEFLAQEATAGQHLSVWIPPDSAQVLIAPATTFLLTNRAVEVQVWLSIGSQDWGRPSLGPLAHPLILGRNWPNGKPWTDLDELGLQQDSLTRLALGLLRRCKKRVLLAVSELGEQGYEQRGSLLRAIHKTL